MELRIQKNEYHPDKLNLMIADETISVHNTIAEAEIRKKEWKQTDPKDGGKDYGQWGRHVGGRKYEFFEYDSFNDELIQFEVDLDDYTKEKQWDNLSAYYSSWEELYNCCGEEGSEEVDWIIAECIFEQESGIY